MFDTRITAVTDRTIAPTVLTMIIGTVGGVIVAMLRTLENPVLSMVPWFHLWVFRGTPVYVQLVFWSLPGIVYSAVNLGVIEVDLSTILSSTFVLAFAGLSLNESVYMVEIVRADIQAVPEGQTGVSEALGMSRWQTVCRTIPPQTMRTTIPPTGNEFIFLLKTISLVIAVPFSLELYGRSTNIVNALLLSVPILFVAATWYLVITSILVAGQFYPERYFTRGAIRQLTARQLAVLADAKGVPLADACVVDKDGEHFYREDPQQITTKDLMVETQEVWKNFGRLEVPKGIDMGAPRSTVTCLIGPPGSGKSTLPRCISHLEKVNTGRLHVDGPLIGYREKNGGLYEVSAAEAARQCRDIGMVFQNFNLFLHRTVLGNTIEAPMLVKGISQEQAERRTMELLEIAGLAHKTDAYPVQLSGGRRQRIAITRALATESKLMLLDELTSALDPELVGETLNVMRGLADKGMTTVVVTYEMDFVREVVDQVVFMADGVVVEKGIPDEILGNPKHECTRNFLPSLLK